jgi:acetyl esterase/lipase
MAPYDWVPLDQMGAIVSVEEADDLSIESTVIDYLLTSYGYAQYTPLPYDVRAWRVRYVTQDRGQPVEATMVLTLPDVSDGASFPLMVAAHGTSGFNDACAPSAGGLEESGFPIIFAAMGYAVAAPDYLGMNGFGEPSGMLHPYLVPEATAVATLDAARAALRFVVDEAPGATIDPSRTTLWGGSEGGFATLWAERYQPAYLPEVSVIGTVALVPPTDLTGIALAGLQAPIPASAGLLAGWSAQHSWYAAPGHTLDEVLVPEVAEALPGELLASCGDYPSLEGRDTLDALFTEPVLAAGADGSLDALDPWACYLAMGDLADTEVPRTSDAPVLVVISEADELVVADVVRASVPRLCEDGYDIETLECAGAGHAEGAVQSLSYQLEWMQARLRGEPLAEGEACAVTPAVDCVQP